LEEEGNPLILKKLLDSATLPVEVPAHGCLMRCGKIAQSTAHLGREAGCCWSDANTSGRDQKNKPHTKKRRDPAHAVCRLAGYAPRCRAFVRCWMCSVCGHAGDL